MTASGCYHCSVKPVGRSNGRSIVAAAAYRHGERLADERTGEIFDYRARSGVLDSFILTRDGAAAWGQQREQLWNGAERAEDRANGRLATELELALPCELDAAAHRRLLKDFLAPLVAKHGIAADVAIHAPGAGGDHRNTHAHVLVTHREFGPDGFGEIANQRTVTRKRKGREVQEKIAGLAATPADIKALRQAWERAVNREYERAGLDIRVDHRSHEDRGIAQEPGKHLGPTATKMERQGVDSERGAVNREILQRNAAARDCAALEAEAAAITIDLEAARALREARAGAQGRYDDVRATARDVARSQHDGRYDVLRAAEPAPEIARAFASGAARTTEPPAPNFDRGVRGGGRMAAKILESVSNAIGGILDFLAGPVAPPTLEEAKGMQRVAEQQAQELADRAAQETQAAAQDWQIFEQNRQRQYDDLMAGRLGQNVPREIQRGDGGRDDEREHERER